MCGGLYIKATRIPELEWGINNRDIFMPDFLLVGYRNGVLKHVNKI